MIPTYAPEVVSDFDIVTQPSYTYRMDLEAERVRGMTDGIDAVRQAIFKILNTERYKSPIYSFNYGVELANLYGKEKHLATVEAESRIAAALLQDDRINAVDSWEVSYPAKGDIALKFVVHSVFGDVNAERTVNV